MDVLKEMDFSESERQRLVLAYMLSRPGVGIACLVFRLYEKIRKSGDKTKEK